MTQRNKQRAYLRSHVPAYSSAPIECRFVLRLTCISVCIIVCVLSARLTNSLTFIIPHTHTLRQTQTRTKHTHTHKIRHTQNHTHTHALSHTPSWQKAPVSHMFKSLCKSVDQEPKFLFYLKNPHCPGTGRLWLLT